MRQINYGMTLSLLLATTVLLSGCASFWKPEKEVVTVTKIVERNIPTIPHPKPVQMNDVKIYVVSPEENFEEFKKEFEAKNGADSYIAISVKDYEILQKFCRTAKIHRATKTDYSLLRVSGTTVRK